MNRKNIKKTVFKNIKGIINVLPILLSVILLISLINTIVPIDFYSKVFFGNNFIDSIIIDFIGSAFAGNPISAYIISEEFIKNGISLVIVSTFILAWTTVGIIQFPAESVLMGKKFAIIRNTLAFIFAIIISFTSVFLYGVIFL